MNKKNMDFNFKNPKFIIAIIILIILLVVVAIAEGIMKENISYEEKYEKAKLTEKTVQNQVVFNYVRVTNWEKVFNEINNEDKAYELKDYVENEMGRLSDYKTWEIKDVTYNQAGLLHFKVVSTRSEVIIVTYDTKTYAVNSLDYNEDNVIY